LLLVILHNGHLTLREICKEFENLLWKPKVEGNTVKSYLDNCRATYRLGPELEITGYSCEDHFLEEDTYWHSWECLANLLKDNLTDGILCDIGMPVM
jgi:hypothetical protein